MLDVHGVSSGGSTGALGNIGTIAAGGDGASTAGVPIRGGAVLRVWGAMSTIADTIQQVRMLSADMVMPQNPFDYNLGTGSLIGAFSAEENLPYVSAARTIAMDQNTGAANNIGFTIDQYGANNNLGAGRFDTAFANRVVVRDTFGAATAVTWASLGFVPDSGIPLETGQYAILGAWVQDLTNYAVVRFEHTDFGGLKPGFPVIDSLGTATARAVVLPQPLLWSASGYQFVYLQDIPVFSATAEGTGLTVQLLDITTDTAVMILNLAKVG